jgi:hypothetical protein
VSDAVATPSWYQIQIHGHLDPSWSARFDGWAIAHDADGTTTLCGPVIDQAALYGQIARVRDLGLTLLAVNPYATARWNYIPELCAVDRSYAWGGLRKRMSQCKEEARLEQATTQGVDDVETRPLSITAMTVLLINAIVIAE